MGCVFFAINFKMKSSLFFHTVKVLHCDLEYFFYWTKNAEGLPRTFAYLDKYMRNNNTLCRPRWSCEGEGDWKQPK